MSDHANTLLSDVLSLPLSERETIALAVWDSIGLEEDFPETPDSSLIEETNRRRDELLNGVEKGITHDELKASLGR